MYWWKFEEKNTYSEYIHEIYTQGGGGPRRGGLTPACVPAHARHGWGRTGMYAIRGCQCDGAAKRYTEKHNFTRRRRESKRCKHKKNKHFHSPSGITTHLILLVRTAASSTTKYYARRPYCILSMQIDIKHWVEQQSIELIDSTKRRRLRWCSKLSSSKQRQHSVRIRTRPQINDNQLRDGTRTTSEVDGSVFQLLIVNCCCGKTSPRGVDLHNNHAHGGQQQKYIAEDVTAAAAAEIKPSAQILFLPIILVLGVWYVPDTLAIKV